MPLTFFVAAMQGLQLDKREWKTFVMLQNLPCLKSRSLQLTQYPSGLVLTMVSLWQENRNCCIDYQWWSRYKPSVFFVHIEDHDVLELDQEEEEEEASIPRGEGPSLQPFNPEEERPPPRSYTELDRNVVSVSHGGNVNFWCTCNLWHILCFVHFKQDTCFVTFKGRRTWSLFSSSHCFPGHLESYCEWLRNLHGTGSCSSS